MRKTDLEKKKLHNGKFIEEYCQRKVNQGFLKDRLTHLNNLI